MVKALRPMPGMQILLMMPISHQEANDLSLYGGLSPFSWTRDDVVVKGLDHTLWIKHPIFIT
jgi:hypothetical protein